MPTPPAMSATRACRRAALVSPPEGPSTITRVPGGTRRAAAVVTELLDRDAQPTPVRRGRQGERVGLPPVPAGEEAPMQDWPESSAAGRGRPADLKGDHAGRLGHHPLDPQPVAQRARHRQDDAKADERRQRQRVQRPPVRARDRLAQELVTGGQLVAEAERDRDVGAHVDGVPHPVGEPPADRHHRGDHDRHEQGEGDRRQQDPRVAGQQIARLARDGDVVGQGVAGGGQHGERRSARGTGSR